MMMLLGIAKNTPGDHPMRVTGGNGCYEMMNKREDVLNPEND